MADLVSPSALRASLSTLRGYADDLEQASFETQATKLRLFVNYFQKDDTVRYLADRLHVRLRDVLKEALAAKPRLPEDPIDRVAFLYEVLFLLKQANKLDLREFLSRAFSGSSIENRWDDFRRSWLASFSKGLLEIERRVESLLADEPVDPEQVFAIALHSSWAADQDGAEETASRKGETTLREAVAWLEDDVRGDLETELEILALEKKKNEPSRERLEEIVTSFAAVSPELGALARAEAGLAGGKMAASGKKTKIKVKGKGKAGKPVKAKKKTKK